MIRSLVIGYVTRIHPSKLSTYLDEISDDPLAACRLAREYGFESVCLRRAWTGYVHRSTQQALATLRSALDGMKVLLLSTDVGLDTLEPAEDEFNRPFLVASYFGARYLRFHPGPQQQRDKLKVWMERVALRSIPANVIPVLEYNPDYGYMSAQELLGFMQLHKRWRLVYDPAAFIIRRNLDPYEQYWMALKQLVVAIDLHDYKIGEGFKPATLGDGRLLETVVDSAGMGIQYILEPGLGRRFGAALNREAVFRAVLQLTHERL